MQKQQLFKTIALVLCIAFLFATVIPQASGWGWGWWKCAGLWVACQAAWYAAYTACLGAITAINIASIAACAAAVIVADMVCYEWRRACVD